MNSDPTGAVAAPQPRHDWLVGRVLERVLLVAGVLLALVSFRLDAAVRTAYDTDWTSSAVANTPGEGTPYTGGADSLLFCDAGSCDRLPSASYIVGYVVIWSLAALCLFAALRRWRRRRDDVGPSVQGVLAAAARLGILGAGVGAFARAWAATGHGGKMLVWAAVGSGVALGAVLFGALVLANVVLQRDLGRDTVRSRLARIVRRQRFNLIALVAYVLLLLVVGQTSGQALDALRGWDLSSWTSASWAAFGVASTMLLALVVYEGAIRLNEERVSVSKRPRAQSAFWFGLGVAIVVVGAILLATHGGGPGILFLGLILVGLGVAEAMKLPKGSDPDTARANAGKGAHAEALAILPLVAVAGAIAIAAADAALTPDVAPGILLSLIPGAALLAVAVLMTQRDDRLTLDGVDRAWWLLMAATVALGAVVSVVLFLFMRADNTVVPAVGGALSALVLFVYAVLVFRISGQRHSYGLAPPLAFAVATAVLVGLHVDVHGTAEALGTLAIVNVALAGFLALMFCAATLVLDHQPPKLFGWFGMRQLPLVSLLIVWWVLSGLTSPKTLHNARIAERAVVVERGHQVMPRAPALASVFDTWRRAQPELRSRRRGSGPVPMMLVASHGGGIRAAVWTAYALDCIVAASPPHRETQKTCVDKRRSPGQQRRAARRVFVASGVSGGAVGLQAYAQEMLEGGLQDRDWVEDRLGRDLASATVGWGLFHDLPNHFLGIAPDEGSFCEEGDCFRRDRAAVLEQAFDGEDEGGPLLRQTWDRRNDDRRGLRVPAETVPLLVTNATVTNGTARTVVSAANLGKWPRGEPNTARGRSDTGRDERPLGGTREVSDVLCRTHDLRLSTAALLGARFPYVSPSGRLAAECGREPGEEIRPHDTHTGCAKAGDICETRLVDGGYVDNTGLLTIEALWPELRRLVVEHNTTRAPPIAPVIVELSNGYQPDLADLPVDRGATGSESLIPLTTSARTRTALAAHARGRAYRIRPTGCTVTISPFLHPGITAPLGWALSSHTHNELRDALVRPAPRSRGKQESLNSPRSKLRRLQRWLEPNARDADRVPLKRCVPGG